MSDIDDIPDGAVERQANAQNMQHLEKLYSQLNHLLYQAQRGGDGSFGLKNARTRLQESRHWMREELASKPEGCNGDPIARKIT